MPKCFLSWQAKWSQYVVEGTDPAHGSDGVPLRGAFSVLAYNILRAIISFVHSISEQDSVDDPTKRGADSLEPLPLVPSLSAARLVIVRSMNELEVRHPGRIPFVHDLSADYTPGDIAVAVG
jgi:hypothetical protein